MATKRDYYEVLGLKRDAQPDEINKAYRRLAMQFHPVRVPRAEHCEKCKGTGAGESSKRRSCETCGGRGAVLQGGGFFSVQRTCPRCQGQGFILSNPCKECDGNGLVMKEASVRVTIPA